MKTFKGFLSEAVPKLKHKVDPIKKSREAQKLPYGTKEDAIKRDKKANNPKPVGRMTGAELRAKFMKKESVEELDELSNTTLQRYKTAANDDVEKRLSKNKLTDKDKKEIKKRSHGYARASRKLTNRVVSDYRKNT